MGCWGNVHRVQRFLLLLVSTVSDTSVEEFVFLSFGGFLFNTTTDRFTFKKNLFKLYIILFFSFVRGCSFMK